jgi:hypothetical protein
MISLKLTSKRQQPLVIHLGIWPSVRVSAVSAAEDGGCGVPVGDVVSDLKSLIKSSLIYYRKAA